MISRPRVYPKYPRMTRLRPGALVALAVALLMGCGSSSRQKPTILLIALDGFRWDYRSLADTPNLDRLVASGVSAKGLIPVFPTKTFPNFYSMVTGLYPANHGIIANTMFDPVIGDTFSLGNREAVADGRWYGGEPLWVTAEKQGHLTAPIFWPGSEAEISGVRPSYWLEFDHWMPHAEKVRQVLAQLDLPPHRRPTFISMYFPDVDDQGHGGNDSSLAASIAGVDTALGVLFHELTERGIMEEINVIVVSDHGMAATDSSRVIFLDDYVDLETAGVIDWSPVLALRPPPAIEEEIYAALKNAHPQLQINWRSELPTRLHYSSHYRIPPIIGIADEGWSVTSHAWYDVNPARFNGNNHGYDNRLASMRGIFIGWGPAFKSGLQVPAFQNIHLYALMCALLDLEAAPNDGSFDSVKVLLN